MIRSLLRSSPLLLVDACARVRLGLLRTREYAGRGREPTNDIAISDRRDYEEIFLAIGRQFAE